MQVFEKKIKNVIKNRLALTNVSTETRNTSAIIDCLFLGSCKLWPRNAKDMSIFNLLAILKHHLHDLKIQNPVDGGPNTQQNWMYTTLNVVKKCNWH